jgi:hypothetical protein
MFQGAARHCKPTKWRDPFRDREPTVSAMSFNFPFENRDVGTPSHPLQVRESSA